MSLRPPLLVLAALAAVLVLAPAAPAAPQLDGTFGPTTGTPGRIARGFDGNMWVVIAGAKLGRISPDGTIKELPTPGNVEAVGITSGPSAAGGPDDRIWLSYNGGVAAFNPATESGTNFPVAEITTAQGIAKDADGNLWVVDSSDGLVEVSPAGALIQEVKTGTSGREIALGGDGRMWWTDFGGGQVHATTTANPAATQDFAVGGNGPQGIAAGPADQVAYGNPGTNPQTVGRLATAGGNALTTNDPAADPFGVTFGADGAYWFAQFAAQSLGRLATDGTLTAPITFPAGSGPRRIAAGPSDTLWVSLETVSKIARVTGVEPPPAPQPQPQPQPEPQPSQQGTTTTQPVTPRPIAIRDTKAPLISRLSIGSKKIAYTLTEGGSVVVTIERIRTGHRRGGRCRAMRPGAPCRRYVRVKRLRRASVAGANGVRFTKSRLGSGRYRLTVVAYDAAGNASAPRRATFYASTAARS